MVNFWFAGWEPIGRIVLVGTLGYLALVVLLRLSGKRTLAQMNSFDFVITIAIGATFGRVMTARSVALAEAVTALALLIALQFIVTFMQTRLGRLEAAITAAPRLLAYDGRIIAEALRRERVTEHELLSAVRKHGFGDLSEVAAVVMESTGRLTVLGPDRLGNGSALQAVAGTRPSDGDA